MTVLSRSVNRRHRLSPVTPSLPSQASTGLTFDEFLQEFRQDFGGWWHELGGEDTDVRRLLAGAMALLDRDTATVLVPPYRAELVAGTQLPPAACALGLPLTAAGRGPFFVDGLDSI